MKYVTIFHANLNYAFLEPYFFERVIRSSYEVIIDTFREKCPDAKYIFEASGFTIEHIAKVCPDVLEKLKDAIKRGQCEFMGAPYAHPILANNPEEDGRWSNEFSMRIYEEYLGFRPESGWNPECTWKQYVPNTFKDVGYKYMTLDFESYKICNDKEYGWVERNRDHTKYWGAFLPWYELDPDDSALHRPFRDIIPGLHGFCRSDRLSDNTIYYFLDQLGLDAFIDNIKKWSGIKKEGALIVFANDAEYCGTTGYFFVKKYQDYSKCFAVDPNAAEKLEALIKRIMKFGTLITFKEACELEPVKDPYYVEDGFAWHRTYAEVWASTPEAQRFDPEINMIRNDYKKNIQTIAEKNNRYKALVEKFWFHLTNSQNSDGRWPPPPLLRSPYHSEWVEREIIKAKKTLQELKEAIRK